MNKVILIGRLTKDPEVRYTQDQTCIARYTLAVDRRVRKDADVTADFISCVAFGKGGEFAEKYLKKGTKVAVTGRIQTGSYTNKSGVRVYTTDVIIEDQEFAESKATEQKPQEHRPQETGYDGFMSIPSGIDEEMPFR